MKITSAGFVIEAEDRRMLTEEQVRDFYSSMEDQVRRPKNSHYAYKYIQIQLFL
jgi:CRISPR/Cas system CSM-associated protein Csm2 small subunit